MKPLFYALLVSDTPGRLEFAGAFESRQLAEQKGAELRRQFTIEEVLESDL